MTAYYGFISNAICEICRQSVDSICRESADNTTSKFKKMVKL